MVDCKECGKDFTSDRSLHAHLKAHKLKVKDYYYKFFPRRDRYDNKLINFINKDLSIQVWVVVEVLCLVFLRNKNPHQKLTGI